MPLPLIPLAISAFNWFRGSVVGRYVAAAVGIMAAVLTARAYWKHQGRAEAKDYIDRASNEAAEKRRQAREKVDLDARRIGSADRLRNRWSRD